MNTLKTYIKEGLFSSDSIEKQINAAIIKKEIIKLFKNINESNILLDDNEVIINDSLFLNTDTIIKLKEILSDNNFHIKKCEYCEIYINSRYEFPEFLNGTEFNQLNLQINGIITKPQKEINVIINELIYIDAGPSDNYKYLNINIYSHNKIIMSVHIDKYQNQNDNITLLNNLNINSNNIDTYILIFYGRMSDDNLINFISSNKDKNIQFINTYFEPVFEKVDIFKRINKVQLCVNSDKKVIYNIKNKKITFR